MFSYIIWFLIILILILIAKRLFEGIILGILYIFIVFFGIFLLDTVTPFPLRDIVSLDWYDKTVEDPGEAVVGVVGVSKKAGEKAIDKVTEAGDNLDVHYGTKYDKEWTKKEGEESEEDNLGGESNVVETNKDKDISEVKNIEKDKKDKPKTNTDLEGKEIYIEYGEVKELLAGELNNLDEGDKDIIRAMTSVYRTRLKGKDIEVWNTGDRGGEGVHVKVGLANSSGNYIKVYK